MSECEGFTPRVESLLVDVCKECGYAVQAGLCSYECPLDDSSHHGEMERVTYTAARSSLARMSLQDLRARLDAVCMEHGSTAVLRVECDTESAWSAEVIVTADNQPGLIDVSYRIEAAGGQTPEEVATAAVENAILWVTERRAGP